MNPQLENKTTVTRPFDVCQRVKFIYVTTITKHVITTNRCIDPSRWNHRYMHWSFSLALDTCTDPSRWHHWYMYWSFSLEPLIHALISFAGTRYMHWSFSLAPDTCTDPSRWNQIYALILIAGTRCMYWSFSLAPDTCTDPSHWHQIHEMGWDWSSRRHRWDETVVAGDTDGMRLE